MSGRGDDPERVPLNGTQLGIYLWISLIFNLFLWDLSGFSICTRFSHVIVVSDCACFSITLYNGKMQCDLKIVVHRLSKNCKKLDMSGFPLVPFIKSRLFILDNSNIKQHVPHVHLDKDCFKHTNISLSLYKQKIKSIQGVMEAYASDKKTTFVKLENQRIICLKGYNANPLYDCLREMYRAQENETFLKYLQGSRSSVSSTERPKPTYSIPAYDFGVCCSENVREYVLKKKFPNRPNPGTTSSKTSLVSGSQSSLDQAYVKLSPHGGISSGNVPEKSNRRGNNGKSDPIPASQKVPLIHKALRELKGTELNDNKYHRATMQQIDEYMRNSFNTDFVNVFTDTQAMHASPDAYDDEDEDIYSHRASHQTLKQYENLPYKEHFPPLTAYTDESGDEHRGRRLGSAEARRSQLARQVRPASATQERDRSNSDQRDRNSGASRKQETLLHPESLQRRHSIANTQKKKVRPRFIKVYRPGHSRPIFISGATTLGGLPEPAPPARDTRLSDRLKHRPIPTENTPRGPEDSRQVTNSCPLFCEVEDRGECLVAGFNRTSSFSEAYLARRHSLDRPERSQETFVKDIQTSFKSKAEDASGSQYETSLTMEKSLQEANDLVRTLFEDMSIGAPAPVLTVATTNTQDSPGITSPASLIDNTAATVSSASVNTPCTTAEATVSSAQGQYNSQPPPNVTSESDSLPSMTSNSEARHTV